MKKFFMMFAVAMMTLVAATTMVSCGTSDEEAKKQEFEGYSLTTSIKIVDPNNELTMQQKTDLQLTISLIGKIGTLYTTDKSRIDREIDAWNIKANTKIKEFIDKNPSVRNTSAGLTISYIGGSETNNVPIYFATFNPANVEK